MSDARVAVEWSHEPLTTTRLQNTYFQSASSALDFQRHGTCLELIIELH